MPGFLCQAPPHTRPGKRWRTTGCARPTPSCVGSTPAPSAESRRTGARPAADAARRGAASSFDSKTPALFAPFGRRRRRRRGERRTGIRTKGPYGTGTPWRRARDVWIKTPRRRRCLPARENKTRGGSRGVEWSPDIVRTRARGWEAAHTYLSLQSEAGIYGHEVHALLPALHNKAVQLRAGAGDAVGREMW